MSQTFFVVPLKSRLGVVQGYGLTILHATNLGVDGQLSVSQQLTAVCRSCFYQLRQMKSVKSSLTREAVHSLMQAFVYCKLDYCNSALAGLAKVYLQSVQNMAARMVPGVRGSERITPVLEDLNWLPVSQRVVIKTALMVWKCVHGVAAAYISATSAYPILPSHVVRICDLQRLGLYWFHAPGLQLDNEVSQSTDQPHG